LQQDTDALQALDAAARAARTRRSLGLASGIDVADGQIDRAQAALELADAQAGHALAWVALCKALGGDPGSTSTAQAPADAATGGTR
ncbi:MAG: TolC family protein, partial [Lysobacter sp.]|nr:TolC family protein [Lysobacter sp.]